VDLFLTTVHGAVAERIHFHYSGVDCLTCISVTVSISTKTARASGETRADVSAVCKGKKFTKL